MAGRQWKVGLDYFELDCHMDEKVKLIQAEYGLKGFAVVVKLFQIIYGQEGYYCEWNNDMLLLFIAENGLTGDSKNLISEIVAACIRRNIFSERLYKKYGILTSEGVQKRYLNAVSRREVVNLKKEYLLLNDGIDHKNVNIISISERRNANYVDINEQRKEKKSKVKNNSCPPEGVRKIASDEEERLKEDFEKIYAIYPKKVGRTKAFTLYKLWLKGKQVGAKRYKLTNKQIYLAVRKYVQIQENIGQDDLTYWKDFSTLMGIHLLDYVEDIGDS